MAALSLANTQLLLTELNNVVGQAWARNIDSMVDQVCQRVPSGSAQTTFFWSPKLNKMRLWNGPRVVQEPGLRSYNVVNQTFENTLGIDRFLVDDLQVDALFRMLPDLVEQAQYQPDYMLRDLLENSGDQTGARQVGMDGLNGFSTVHPQAMYQPSPSGAATYPNDFTGGGQVIAMPTPAGGTTNVTVGGAFGPTAVMTLIGYMKSLKAEDNETFGVNPNLLVHHPQLEGEVNLVLKSMFFAPPAWSTITGQVGAAENPIQKYGLKPYINRLLTLPFVWYLFDTTRSFKPLIHTVRNETVMVPRVNENDPVVYANHQLQYGQWNRQAVAFGPPWMFARSGP
jgi:phage major head subunit gpT-like protein